MGSEEAIDQLKEIGFSGYEAKAYVALLGGGRPLNGYEVAKLSGVPRSTVYETLAKLVERGAAFEVHVPDSGAAYLALPADALVGRLRRTLDRQINALSATLPHLTAPSDVHLVQHVAGADGVLERACDVIEGARETLFASIWPEDADALVPALVRAERRGVEVSVIAFGHLGSASEQSERLAHLYQHRYSSPDVVRERVGGRILAVVADSDSAIVAGAVGVSAWGLWSDDPAMALVVAEYVRHDIAVQLLAARLGDDEVAGFWERDPDLERLRASSALSGRLAPVASPLARSRRRSA